VDLVDEQHRRLSLLLQARLGLPDRLAQVLHARHHRRQRREVGADLRRDDAAQGGLPGAGRPPQDHRRQALLLQRPAQPGPGTQELVLTHHLCQRARTHPLGQRLAASVFARRALEQVHGIRDARNRPAERVVVLRDAYM